MCRRLELPVVIVVPVEIDRMLQNWGRWVRDSKQSASRCRSIEHRYRPDEEGVRPMTGVVDALDAALVEGVMRFLPVKDRALLVGHYVDWSFWQPLARILGMRMQREYFDAALRKAALMAWHRYEIVAKRKSSCVYSAPQFVSA